MALDPTLSVLFPLYNATTGAPLTGALPVFTVYETLAGAGLPQPTIVEIGGGFYGFQPAATDISTGSVYIIDGTVAANPRYQAGANQPTANVAPSLSAIQALCQTAVNVLTGNWSINTTTNILYLFAPGVPVGTTGYISRFNLTDNLGAPTSTNIYTRVSF